MRIKDKLVRAAHKADTCGMDEAQARAVVEAVLDELIDLAGHSSGSGFQVGSDSLRNIRRARRRARRRAAVISTGGRWASGIRWPLVAGEWDRLLVQLKGVPEAAYTQGLKARGYSDIFEVVPERRASVAAGIADDWRNRRGPVD